MITRKQVALRAGVSEATVSHVINQTKYVSQDLTKRVLNAAEQLNYHPNLIARSLVTKVTDHVAIIVDDIKNPYYGEIAEGMNEVASREGYIVSLISARSGNMDAFRDLIARKIDGVFFTSSSKDFLKVVEEYKKSGMAVVGGFEDTPFVVPDYSQSIDTMVKYLYDIGHRKIGYLSGLSLQTNADRYPPLIEAMKKYGMPIDESIMIDGVFPYRTGFEEGYISMKKLLSLETRVTAVFATNDLMALGAIKAIRETSLKIPDDISIIGCDDIYFSESTDPPLSTIRTPKKEMGRRAMYLLIDQLRNRKTEDAILTTDFIIRKSTGPAKY